MTSDEQLRSAAVAVLRRNDLGHMVTAAPDLYPHMWSWDAAFVAAGLTRVSVPRAIQELSTLVAAQWSSGMIPHIVFSGEEGYLPGVDRWGTTPYSPRGVRSSGICQPPVHAIALRHILDAGRAAGGGVREEAEAFLTSTMDRWAAWHEWLASARDPDRVGLLEIHHGWESGMDNSPRFDGPYSRVRPGALEPYERADLKVVRDPTQRPTDEEYDRYLWLVKQMADVGYDDDRVREVVDFRVRDVFMSAVMALGCRVLAGVAREVGREDVATRQDDLAARFTRGVDATLDPGTGLARDYDIRAGEWVSTQTVAGFSPLLSSQDPQLRRRQWEVLRGRQWLGHPRLAHPLPPSTCPDSPDFRPRQYWRGPVWPFLNWLIGWSVLQHGEEGGYDALREASLAQLGDLRFAEYYEPLTCEPLGSMNQSWTAAVSLLWLDGV